MKEGNPIGAGVYHGDGLDGAGLEPVAEVQQIVGKGGERTHGFGIGIEGDSDLNLAGAEVNSGGVGMKIG